MPVIVVGTVAYAALGLACIAVGVRTRKGVGKYKVSRSAKVSYEELPLRERTRTGNALLVLGVALLLCSPFSLLPGPAVAVVFLVALCCFVAYLVIQVGLRRAAQAVVRAKAG
ncbi:hypothetical protein F8568_002430 [Actinomadura sp. LD22]|uniref:Uncharacterized protein n=1 Tax=Actinomadura physcomitrii TaxID=2650748 RepID=A0A6I4M0J0_9ACTN|nr:hypothetical protein [Actinomadura physcomitrii]MVZ99262.1 hypothetical protein [Actinomadura physcomitrii]